jgi:hypothetical protein
MAKIAFAAAASHAPGLTGWFGKADADEQAAVRGAYQRLREALTASRVDLLILVGNEHVANARVYDYPDFTVGLAPGHIGPDEWFRPWLNLDEYRIPADRWWLDLLAEGDHERVLSEATFDRMEQAGAGGTSELLSWQVVMGAIGEKPCTVRAYACVPEWRCGIGAVLWDT